MVDIFIKIHMNYNVKHFTKLQYLRVIAGKNGVLNKKNKDAGGLLCQKKGLLPRREMRKNARSTANSYEFAIASCIIENRKRQKNSHRE